MASMKMHQLRRGFWDHEPRSVAVPAAGFKSFRSLPPPTKQLSTNKINNYNRPPSNVARPLDLKSFIKPDNAGSRKIRCTKDQKKLAEDYSSVQVEEAQQASGTRWNPTQEQIGILEMLYRGGMRTPNTQQIEEITEQLANYGKIEGKNVFYWFQNHKARERQKIKRKKSLSHSPRTTTIPAYFFTTINSPNASINSGDEESEDHDSQYYYYYKRKCRSWASTNSDQCFELLEDKRRLYGEEEDDEIITLELFPLHPEVGK